MFVLNVVLCGMSSKPERTPLDTLDSMKEQDEKWDN